MDDLIKRLVWLLIFLIQAPLCWSADRTLNNEITHFEELQRAVGSKCINNPEASSVRIDVDGKAHNCAQLISVVNRLGKRIDDQVDALEAKCEAETQRGSEVNDVAVQSLQIAQRAGQCKPKSTDVSCMESVGCMIKSVANPLASILESRFNIEKKSCFANGLNSASNCFTEIARGIVTSLVTTMKGIWGLGKLAAVKTAQLFGFLQESEKASSDKLMAAQQASPSFTSQFIADPSKALSTLTSKIYNGLKNAAMNTFGCEKWDGVPLDPRSKCIRPMTNWNCASCDQKIQVFCGIGGLAAGEIVTGFFTGGLASGAAHIGRGVAASVKLASKSRTMSAAGARGYNSAKAIIATIPKSAEGIQGATRLAIRAASASRVVMTKTEAAALRSWSAVQQSPINKSFQAFARTKSGKVVLFPANATTMYLRAIESSVKAGSRTVDTLVARTTAGTRAITVAAKPVELRTFVAENASDKLTTPLENAAWIEVAQAGKKPGQFFVDSQNRLLKQINDKVKDKALADALTNKSSRMMADTLEAFKAKHPGITVDFYSDYKGMRAVVRGPPANQQQLMSELAIDLQRTEVEFSKLIKDNKLLPDELADAHIVSTGVRESYDESNIMSRFGSNVTWDEIGDIWKQTEAGRESLAAKFGDTRLMKTAPGTTKKVFKAEMIEVIRKKLDDVEAAAILSRRYNMTISPTDVTLIRENLAQVNNFAPGLMLADRVQHRFDRAQHGGLTIDFAGVGSYNLEATQIGLAQGDNIADAIVKVRTNEGLVTSDLDRIKRETSRQVQDILRKNGISSQMTVSGDDFVAIPNKPIPEAVKEEIIVATSRGDSVKRASFFPSGMPNARSRAILAVEGEGIEKILRSRLEKYLSQQELSSLIFTTDMRGTKPGFGPVGLIMNVPKGMSQTKIRTINQQFGMAVKDMSSNLKKQGRESQFTVAP